MRPFLWYLWLAGAVQLVILLANIPLPKKLRCRENLARVSPMIRAVFIVHWAYIVLVLGIFTALCFGFASDLAGSSRLDSRICVVARERVRYGHVGVWQWRDCAKFICRARHAVPLLANGRFDVERRALLNVEGVGGFVFADLVAEVVVDGF